jgi:ketosteroid isomerase-like protein
VGGPNVEIVHRAFAAFERRDLAGLLELCSRDMVLEAQTARVAADGRPYRGHEGLRRYLADVARVWEELRPEPEHCRELDPELVVCTGRIYAWGVGRVVDTPAGWLWRVREGLIVHGTVFESARAALEAAEAAVQTHEGQA